MFFPATHGDKIVLDPNDLKLDEEHLAIDKKYL